MAVAKRNSVTEGVKSAMKPLNVSLVSTHPSLQKRKKTYLCRSVDNVTASNCSVVLSKFLTYLGLSNRWYSFDSTSRQYLRDSYNRPTRRRSNCARVFMHATREFRITSQRSVSIRDVFSLGSRASCYYSTILCYFRPFIIARSTAPEFSAEASRGAATCWSTIQECGGGEQTTA